METKKTLKVCKNRHKFYKSSDCPICPICEKEQKTKDNFQSMLAAPARRALVNSEIMTLKQLSKFSEEDILKLHGIGKTSIPILKKELESAGLTFNKN